MVAIFDSVEAAPGGGGAAEPPPSPVPTGPSHTNRWTVARVAFLLVPVFGIWFAAASLLPSPVGVLVPAAPYLLLALGGSAVVLAYGLLRPGDAPRFSAADRPALVVGVAAGLGIAGLVGLVGTSVLGCPSLPPATEIAGVGNSTWETGPLPSWQENGRPVVFFYGATWCPYCSASSWVIWKALDGFGSVVGVIPSYSYGPPEQSTYTPELVLASASLVGENGHPPAVAFQATEYNGSRDQVVLPPANCEQKAYLAAYDSCSHCGIPFLVVGGRYVHIGTLADPRELAPWNRTNDPTGATFVESSVASENGTPWTVVQAPVWWMMAVIAEEVGAPVATLASEYGWSTATQDAVAADVSSLS